MILDRILRNHKNKGKSVNQKIWIFALVMYLVFQSVSCGKEGIFCASNYFKIRYLSNFVNLHPLMIIYNTYDAEM